MTKTEVSITLATLKKNSCYSCRITGYTAEGLGVGHIDDQAVFVPQTLPVETWQVRIQKVTSHCAYGKALELCDSPAAARRQPECPVYGKCGGCATLHMDYAEELRFKLDKVNQALHRIGSCAFTIPEILPAPVTTHYRNKSIVSVGTVAGRTVAGFYRQRSHDIIPADNCLLQDPLSNRVNRAVLAWMERHQIPPYDEQSGRGCVRHIFTRTNRAGQILLTIVSARGFGAATQTLAPELLESCPELCGIVLNINKTKGNSVLSGDFYPLWGTAELQETLCGFRFSIAPQAFFQINPTQAERLYERAVEYAAPRGGTVLDLYCGTGTISLCLSRKADHVIGAEIVPEAVQNAKENADRNGVSNVEFLCADAAQAATEFQTRGIQPDCIVVDPPRKGMYPEALIKIAEMAPARIVYVSCDPATLARDVKRLGEYGYSVTAGTVVDMFPHTNHVETVVLLSKGEIDSKKVRVEFSLEDMDMSDFQDKATYTQIKDYVLEHSGLKVSNLYISQIKRKCGLDTFSPLCSNT